MARNDRESAYPTLWSLEVLRVAADADSWDEVTAELGVGSKHQVLRTVARLQEKLDIHRGLLIDRENRPYVPEGLLPIVDEFRVILTSWEAARAKAGETERSYFVRVDGFWSHIENFAAPAVTGFRPIGEWSKTTVRVELVPRFGAKRATGGAGMVSDLQQPNPRADLVLAFDDEEGDPPGVTSRRLYSWALIAAVDKNHPLRDAASDDRVIDVEDLCRYPLAVSPKGHRTRDLLDLYQSSVRRFDVRFVSEEPAALLAFGHDSDIVPILASDSTLAVGPWLTSRTSRPRHAAQLPDHWLAVGARSGVLGGAYRAYWRTDDRPRGMRTIIGQLADALHTAASEVDERVERWRRLLPASIRA